MSLSACVCTCVGHQDWESRFQFIHWSVGFYEIQTLPEKGGWRLKSCFQHLLVTSPASLLGVTVGTKVFLALLQLVACLCFIGKRRKPRKNLKKDATKYLKMPEGTMEKQSASWEKAWQGYCSLLSCCCTFSGVQYLSLYSWKIIIFLLDLSSVTLENLCHSTSAVQYSNLA